MTINEIAESLNINTGKCRRAIAELEAKGTVKSLGFIRKESKRNFKDYPAETLTLVKEWTSRPPDYQHHKDDGKKSLLKPSQRIALNLLITGLGLGNKQKAPQGFSGRLMDGIHTGQVKG